MDFGIGTRTPFAFYDPDSCSWRTSALSLFEDSGSSSVTWPRSGMTRNGVAYALQTLVPRTDGSVCSSLLPTPVANDSGNTPEDHLRKKPGRDVVTSLAIVVENDLLVTGGRLTHQNVTPPGENT